MSTRTENLSARFRQVVQEAAQALATVTPERAKQPSRPGGWLRCEELGHLLDSAQNNHQRITLAVLNGRYEGPAYAQNGWVALHGYADLDWQHLLRHWQERNWMLGRVVSRIPEDRLDAPVSVSDDGSMTLEAWVDDYLQHLQHHVAVITRQE